MCNALLNSYRSFIFEIKLPNQVFKSHIQPSLEKLSRDFHRMGIVAQETACLHLIAQIETDYGACVGSGGVGSSSGLPNLSSGTTMPASPSMDEMKS